MNIKSEWPVMKNKEFRVEIENWKGANDFDTSWTC